MRPARFLIECSPLVVLGLLAAGGCQASYSQAGATRTVAAYEFGSLKADLPQTCRVPAVVAAGEAALRHRGYAITASSATDESGTVEAKSPAARNLGNAEVWAEVIPDGTRVGVKVGLLGDEDASRAILDDVLRRLGL